MRIILNISIWLIALNIFASYETANAQEDLLKKYFGKNGKERHGEYLIIRAKDARGVIDSVKIILDTNATFNLDSNLGEENLIDIPKKDLDLRLVRKSSIMAYVPDKEDTNGIKCWIFYDPNLSGINSNVDLETKIEIIPTSDLLTNIEKEIPSTNFTLKIKAKFFPIEIYVSKFKMHYSRMYLTSFVYDSQIESFKPIAQEYKFIPYVWDDADSNKKQVIKLIDSTDNELYILINDWTFGGDVDKDDDSNILKAIELIPKNGFLSIENKDYSINSPLHFIMIDINSNLIREIILNNVVDNYQIEVDELPNGVYFLYSEELKKYYKFKIGKGE